jgi:hypothetical protein
MCSDAPQLMASTAAHCTDKRSDPVDQYKVAQVIGAELHLSSAGSRSTNSKLPPLARAPFCTCSVAESAFLRSLAAPTTCAPFAASEGRLNSDSG